MAGLARFLVERICKFVFKILIENDILKFNKELSWKFYDGNGKGETKVFA